MALTRHEEMIKRWRENGRMFEQERNEIENRIKKSSKKDWYKRDGKYECHVCAADSRISIETEDTTASKEE